MRADSVAMRRALRDSEETFVSLADGGGKKEETPAFYVVTILCACVCVGAAANLMSAHAEVARPGQGLRG